MKKTLKIVGKKFLRDGKVVIVEVKVLDPVFKAPFVTTGRAICNLDEDEFDLDYGVKLATSRAFEKAKKKIVKKYDSILSDAIKFYDELKEQRDSVASLEVLPF